MEENALVQVFSNSEFGSVRTVTIDNEPWFVGKDVCGVFGDTNHKRSLSRIDDEDKMLRSVKTNGGIQNVTVINESGLYALLFCMQPAKAKGVSQNDSLVDERIDKVHRFKRWVTSEVIPSIRKHGGYVYDPEKFINENFPSFTEETKKNMILDLYNVNKQLTAKVEEQKPKVTYCDNILNSPALTPITTIAKDYGMSGKKMNQLLSDLGIQYKRGSSWYLYQQYADKGYTQSKTYGEGIVFTNTEWTQTGRMFLYEELKKHHILPVIERNNLTEVI